MRARYIAAIVAAGALARGFASVARADAYSCSDLAKSKCVKFYDKLGLGPHDPCRIGRGSCKTPCCDKPPCLYYYELGMWKMLQAIFADEAFASCAKDGEIEPAAHALASSDAFLNALPTCPGMGKIDGMSFNGQHLSMPPSLDTGTSGSSCDIEVQRYPASLKILNEGWNTCSELWPMLLAHEEVHLQSCLAVTKAGKTFGMRSNKAVAREEVKGYQKEIDQMRRAIRDWPTGCSTEQDTKKALSDARDGIRALKGNVRGMGVGGCPAQ